MTRSPSPLFATGIFFSVGPFDVSKWIDPVKAWSVTPPVRKPVPSSIFLPLRLSWFLFSLGVSSALIDFKIEVNELISFVLASTSSCIADDDFCKAFASSNNFLAFSTRLFCFSFERTRSTCSCKAVILSTNLLVSTVAFFSSVNCSVFSTIVEFFSSTGVAFSVVSLVFFSSTNWLSTDGVAWFVFASFAATSFGASLTFSFGSCVDEVATSFVAGSFTSLASTWNPKKNPAPTNTLAAPTFNFLIEYFWNFLPYFCWFIKLLFLLNIAHLKIKYFNLILPPPENFCQIFLLKFVK